MNKKILGSVFSVCIAFAAMGCPSDTSSSSDLLARIQVAEEKYRVKCNYSSAASAKIRAAKTAAEIRAVSSLAGVNPNLIPTYVAALEASVESCVNADIKDPALLRGTLKDGDACFWGAQCGSSLCAGGQTFEGGWKCGVCAPALAIGDSCDSSNSRCAVGVSCSGAQGQQKCTDSSDTRVAIGGDCSAASCVRGALCNYETVNTTTTRTCVALPKVGESCVRLGTCDNSAYCSGTGATRTCVAYPKLGETCTDTPCQGGARCDKTAAKCVDGSTTVAVGGNCASGYGTCAEGSYCNGTSNGNTSEYVCVATRKLGESCGVAKENCGTGLYCTSAKVCASDVGLSCPLK